MNHILKRIPVAVAVSWPIKVLLQRLSEGVVPIFVLHRIEDRDRGVEGIPVKTIELFLNKLKSFGYSPMGMEELLQQINMPSGVINNRFIVMMDDGYLDQVDKGIAVFQKSDCPVSVALITDFISNKSWPWDAKVRYLFERTEEKSLSFVSNGNVSRLFDLSGVGNRFSAMRIVREILKTQTEAQVNESLRVLEERLNIQLPDFAPDSYMPCSWSDVKQLEGSGVTFIPHTKNHYILSNLTDERAREEIQGSIKEINEHINALPLFVYPNGKQGDYKPHHFQILRENGIKAAFTTNNTYFSFNDLDRNSEEPLVLPRLGMPDDSFVQEKIITKVDYISDRYNSGTLKRTFETSFGIKRTAALKAFEVLTKRYYLQKSKELEFDRINRVVFICVGNICRSPFAEIIAQESKLNIAVTSAGIEASGVDRPNPTARKIAKEFGYNMDHLCSTNLKDIELLNTDLLVVMEPVHLDRLSKIIIKINCQATLLGAWDDTPMLSIDDPYGRNESRFRMIFSHIQVSVNNLIEAVLTKKCLVDKYTDKNLL